MTKEEYKALKTKYKELKNSYRDERFNMQQKNRESLEELKNQYKIEKYTLKEPLKAEKYRLKVEKRKQHRLLNEAPRRKTLEEIGNAISHGIGVPVGITFLVLMLSKSHDVYSALAAWVFGLCFTLQMLFSCLYHCFRSGTTVKRLFRRFDYATIFLQIGGSFAPLFLIFLPEYMWGIEWGIALFITQWVIIIAGISFIGVYGPGRIKWLHYTLFFVVGWSGLIFIPYWIKYDLYLLYFILGGGIIYTLGMIPFGALRNKPVTHFIWHFVVLLAAICMALGYYLCVFC